MSYNPFEIFAPTRTFSKPQVSPASEQTSLRVDFVGRKILAENPAIALKPVFVTAGLAKEEIFHQDTRAVWITEGLANRCKDERGNPDEGALAALLSLELAKMVAEREAVASPQARRPEARPPITVPVGNAGQFHDQDQTAVAERALFEKDNPRKPAQLARLNPHNLARGYLEKAGYQRGDLDRIEPLLQAADRNCELERQIKGLPPQSNWTP